MNQEKQQKTEETPVISPLANEKTYGERMYARVFDWGLNYWTNLLASAGFSQYAEHATRPIKLPFMEAATPRQMQQRLAGWLKEGFWMRGLYDRTFAEKGASEAVRVVAERSMSRARSLTLLLPGFVVMIPSVWLGAKIKPKFVEWFNRRHYGEEAMDDPSLQARHQAIEAEARPTFIGTVIGRMGTVLAVQAASQTIGSDHNRLNKLGEKHGIKPLQKFAIDPITEKIGSTIGGAMPAELQERYNRFAVRHGLDWSIAQADRRMNQGPYTNAAQDLGRFIMADTFYTAISAGTIRPIMKWLPRTPIIGPILGRFMSYKPKTADNSPIFDSDGKLIKVPANRYADTAEDAPTRTPEPAANDPVAADAARAQASANDEKFDKADREKKPATSIRHAQSHETLAARAQPHLAGAGA